MKLFLAPYVEKGGNYIQFDSAKMPAYHAEADRLKRCVAEWEAAFHGAYVVEIKNKELAAVDAWRRSPLPTDALISNG